MSFAASKHASTLLAPRTNSANYGSNRLYAFTNSFPVMRMRRLLQYKSP